MTISKDEEIKKRGLQEIRQIITPSNNLLQFLKGLEELPIAKKVYDIHPMSLGDSIFDAQQFLDYYYDLRQITSLQEKRLLGFRICYPKNISPYKLPITLVEKDDVFSGSVTEIITRKSQVLFREINLSSKITEQTSSSYVHEITHTQLDNLKGSIKHYFNLEILSIFNELFHASILDKDERILRLNDSRRICEMSITAQELDDHHKGYSQMNREDLLDCCKYLVSDLKAYNLFITFYYGTDKLKNEILDDIQSIFDGYMTVEELLKKYDITFKSSQENKKLLKYFTR